MGKGDLSSKNWLQDKRRYSDLFNGFIFGGKQVIRPEELEQVSGEADIILTDKDGQDKKVQRYRDIVMRWKKGIDLVVFACESQQRVHYAMPVRMMVYDGLGYVEQVTRIWEEHEKNEGKRKVKRGEWLSRFRKDDKLIPVISIVFYYGSEEWDASVSLHEMLDLPEGIEERRMIEAYIPDYRINLFHAGKVEHIERFQTDLQVLFQMLKYRDKKEELVRYVNDNRAYFGNMDRETVLAFGEFLQAGALWNRIVPKESQEGEIDMCKALQDLYDEGIECGMERGMEQKIYEQVSKKLAKGKTVPVIAEELEEPEEKIREIIAGMTEEENEQF